MTQTKKKLLIVDDEKELADLLAQLLGMYQFETQIAYSGNEAFEKVRNESFDCIVSDIRMADGDGVSLLQNLKRANLKIPLIFMTGYADYSTEKLLQMGALHVFAKPLKAEDLIEVINSKIEPHSL